MEGGLLRDEDWRPLDGEPCRVIAFRLFLGAYGRKGLPYASIEIESPALAEPTTGFITHKLDFQHLDQVFNVRGVADDEEVIVFWRKSSLNKRAARLFSRSMPGLIVWLCPKHSYDLATDPSFRPELEGQERLDAMRPIETWEPEVLR